MNNDHRQDGCLRGVVREHCTLQTGTILKIIGMSTAGRNIGRDSVNGKQCVCTVCVHRFVILREYQDSDSVIPGTEGNK